MEGASEEISNGTPQVIVSTQQSTRFPVTKDDSFNIVVYHKAFNNISGGWRSNMRADDIVELRLKGVSVYVYKTLSHENVPEPGVFAPGAK